MIKTMKKKDVKPTKKISNKAKAGKTGIDLWAKAKAYVGLKEIRAMKMTRGKYCKFKGWNLPADEDSKDKGYLIKYTDGYISWSPTKQFEDAYMETGKLGFSEALFLMKQGFKVARKGWDGKKMWVTISTGTEGLKANKFWNKHNKQFAKENGGSADVLACFTMKTAQNTILMGWAPTQSDLLAEDWCVIS